MRSRRPLSILVLAVAYLAAAALPCPPAAERLPPRQVAGAASPADHHRDPNEPTRMAGHAAHGAPMAAATPPATQRHAHAVTDPAQAEPATFVTAPCLCGCDGTAFTPSGRLGPVVLAAVEPLPAWFDGFFGIRRIEPFPNPPLHLPEAIPIVS